MQVAPLSISKSSKSQPKTAFQIHPNNSAQRGRTYPCKRSPPFDRTISFVNASPSEMRGRRRGHDFFGGHCRIPTRSCYRRKTLRRARCGGAYLVCSGRGRPQIRWGVVQPVGHHTVNVDGEGSNPSAPAKFSLVVLLSWPPRSETTVQIR